MRALLPAMWGYKLAPHEVAAARHGFTAFAFVLSSYFILLPLREDVALTLAGRDYDHDWCVAVCCGGCLGPVKPSAVLGLLRPLAKPHPVSRSSAERQAPFPGPAVLPRLFIASLGVTALTAPLVTTYIVHPAAGSRAAGFRRLCRVMAGCLIGLWVLLLLTAHDPWVAARLLMPRRWLAAAATSISAGGSSLGSPLRADIGGGGSGGGGSDEVGAVRTATSWYGNAVRVCFYVYLSLQSLLSTSTLWAVCADTFTAATSTKVYGFLGAGATLGQLLASAAALGFGAACKTTGATGAAPWLLVPAAALVLAAGRSCQAMAARAEALQPYGSNRSSMDGQYDSSSGGCGGGRLGPGNDHKAPLANFGGGGGGGGVGDGAKDGSANFGGAAAAATVTAVVEGPGGGGGGDAGDGGGAFARGLHGSTLGRGGRGGRGGGWLQRVTRGSAASHAGRLLEGFRLIAASPYLLATCAFLALHYSTSATLYFLRAQLVSEAAWLAGSDARIAFFAALNTASAGIIFAAQMLLTGRVLTGLGVAPTLLVGPLVSLAGMAAIALAPSPATIAGVEVVRKVVQYSLARPGREVLFTVVSRREKYAAKVVLDTVVQRAGDTAAAAAFQVVGVWLSLGPSAVAAVGLALCGAHIAVTAALGRMYCRRKAAAALAAKEVQQQQLHNL